MRLLNVHTSQLEEFFGMNIPDYAILSHTSNEEEVTFSEIGTQEATRKKGFKKIDFACKQAIKDKSTYIWIDTCCIDKTSSCLVLLSPYYMAKAPNPSSVSRKKPQSFTR
ncbi:hypothetical protein BT63DRAFT_411145 [Microthyrium microscopicum]|uniref:Heterokaryon incompatibility domain-containing protein n=1 Tax=Microthyrium microscopicum TaxID=703497 RepID=A0A6A6UK03_9PEZI|nr:hypothetical protein BT63DRAFT_411145 [Microthyrium microscopicum]